MEWAYGVTTIRKRLTDGTLARTLRSLANAGFARPRLFVDGSSDGFEIFQLDITRRQGSIRTYGNWLLGMAELYIRNPLAERFAMFQDDFVACRGLREYLSNAAYPNRGYLNLFTFPHNQPAQLTHRVENGVKTHEGLDPETIGFYPSCQHGKGAVALIFDLEAIMMLLSQLPTWVRCQNMSPIREGSDWKHGQLCVDGAIHDSLKPIGFTEYVHNPSLVQHIGFDSTMGNPKHQQANSFRGEDWDATELLPKLPQIGDKWTFGDTACLEMQSIQH